MQRNIERIATVPPPVQGFAGPGHFAALVVSPEDFLLNDPFILLADDHLDIGDRPVGGPHPHAGFETVTLGTEGAIYDRDEGGVINAGEVQWMTAGRGIIHGENVATKGKVRLLQLWLTLPRSRRWTSPRFQDIHRDAVPVRHENGVEVRIYSGASGNLQSATRNYVPVIITESVIGVHATIDQDIPLSFNGFIYVIRGSIEVADSAKAHEDGSGRLARSSGRQENQRLVDDGRSGRGRASRWTRATRRVHQSGLSRAVHRRYQRRYSQASSGGLSTGNSSEGAILRAPVSAQ